MIAFIGIFYLQAVLRSNILNNNSMRYHEISDKYIRSIDVFESFLFLTHFIEFDDIHNCNDRCEFDKFTCIRDFFEQVNKNNATHCISSAYLVIDETLYPYREHISIKQYNPSKSAKYGLLYHSLCDSLLK